MPTKRGTLRFRAFGFNVNVDPSTWLIVLLIMFFMLQTNGRGGDIRPEFVIAIAIYGLGTLLSVLIHELAHAFSARAFGHQVKEISLHFWGGHTLYSGNDRAWVNKFVIALAGPVSNLALATLSYVAMTRMEPGTVWVDVVAFGWCYINIAMAVINGLPINPLDGGHALTAVLERLTGNVRLAARIAWIVSLSLGGFAILCGIVFFADISRRFGVIGAAWLILGGGYMAYAAWNSYRHEKQLWRGYDFRWERLARPCVMAEANATLASLAHAITAQSRIVVLDDGARVVAIVDETALMSVPSQAWEQVTVGAVSRRVNSAGIFPGVTNGIDSLAYFLENTEPEYVVVDEAGLPLAVISRAGILAYWNARKRN